MKRQPTIKISAITVKKGNVQPHIQLDSNKLYNYMVSNSSVLLDRIDRIYMIFFIILLISYFESSIISISSV